MDIARSLIACAAAAACLALTSSLSLAQPTTQPSVGLTSRPQADGRLSFQTQGTWNPRVNLNADIAMVYDIDKTLPDRIATWREKGYTIHVMTGVAWGEYQDYLFGQFDGKNHEDEAQTMKSGHIRSHGVNVPYMSPSEAYGRYLCIGVKRALDAGADAIHLEEPEFWSNTGWEPNFKRQWKEYYGEEWQEPDSSPDAQYRTSKLKYHLYRRALNQVFDYVKAYNKEHGKDVKCYVPTHSLINYAHWGIVSPQSSLMDVGCDGYIAQVWTGTARTPNFYQGVERQRTFETAFLEYGSMQNLVRHNNRRMWYLNDPIEDNPNHSWWDYRTNWESTLVASLLQPDVHDYEIMPWPHRIFERDYPSTQPSNENRNPKRIPMPPEYETELQAVITAMGDLDQPEWNWEISGSHGIGLLVSDTLMFQRADPSPSDSHFGNFYGLAMPLIKRGMIAEAVQMETSPYEPYKVMLLTYEGQKPPTAESHEKIAAWVRAGGALVMIDNDRDPYLKVREWWNEGENKFETPRHHLFELLGVDRDKEGVTKVGNGVVVYASASPNRLSRTKGGGDRVRAIVREAADAVGHAWKESNAIVLRRGPYVIAAGLDESVPDAPTQKLEGRFIDLFDYTQTVSKTMELTPARRTFAIDLNKLPKDGLGVIAAACRIRDELITTEAVTFRADGTDGSNAVVSILLPTAPKSITLDDAAIAADAHDFADGILRIRFKNKAEGVAVKITR